MCNVFAYVLVLNEVPSSKIKEKQQEKLMGMDPAVKDDDRQQQQSRDREMREAHGEKQNYSISKSRELKVYNILFTFTTYKICSRKVLILNKEKFVVYR